MGVASSPTSTNLITHSGAVDLFQFKNGIQGSGPLGFQAGILLHHFMMIITVQCVEFILLNGMM